MDKTTQEVFDSILALDKDTLTEEQRGFLMARRSYFNDEQRARYKDLIADHEKTSKGGAKKGE